MSGKKKPARSNIALVRGHRLRPKPGVRSRVFEKGRSSAIRDFPLGGDHFHDPVAWKLEVVGRIDREAAMATNRRSSAGPAVSPIFPPSSPARRKPGAIVAHATGPT